MKYLYLVIATQLIVSLYGCKNSITENRDSGIVYFGDSISIESVMSFNELINRMETKDEVLVTVSGKVESVCQAKGCWMNITSPDGSIDDEMFVKFKDYGFFMPLDISGNEVIMKGKAFKEETSVDELRHYAEDEGKTQEEINAIVNPVFELKFMAEGVVLKPSVPTKSPNT